MKKIFAILIVCFSMCAEIYAVQSYDGVINRDVKIKIVLTGSVPRPRSPVYDLISAELIENQLFVNFNEPVGKVAVSVKNFLGQVVSKYSCDTTYEPMVMITVPTETGYYTIDISGSQIEAIGEYTK